MSQPTQRRRKDAVKYLSFGFEDVLDWYEIEVATTFFEDVVKMFSKKRPKDAFQETSLRPLLGDVLKTFSRRRPQHLLQETSLRRLRLHQDFFW